MTARSQKTLHQILLILVLLISLSLVWRGVNNVLAHASSAKPRPRGKAVVQTTLKSAAQVQAVSAKGPHHAPVAAAAAILPVLAPTAIPTQFVSGILCSHSYHPAPHLPPRSPPALS